MADTDNLKVYETITMISDLEELSIDGLCQMRSVDKADRQSGSALPPTLWFQPSWIRWSRRFEFGGPPLVR